MVCFYHPFSVKNVWRTMLHMSRFKLKARSVFISTFFISALIVVVISQRALAQPTAHYALPVQARFNHFLSTNYDGDGQYGDNNPGSAAEQEQYGDRAYPNNFVSYDQAIGAY